MGWKRRFGNRAEIESSSPSDEVPPEVEDNIPLGRPYLLNNKIYPGLQQQEESLKEKAEDLRKREVQLQKIICVLLCTIFPLLTTVATILRLWQTGVLSFSSSQPGPGPCPPDWLAQSQLCLHQLPASLNWSQAEQSCRDLQGTIPNSSNSDKLHLYLVSKCQTPLWLGGSSNSSSGQCEYLSQTAAVEKTSCSKKMTGVCTRAASLTG